MVSFQNFIIINSILMTMGWVQYILSAHAPVFLVFVLRNLVLIGMIEHWTRDKPVVNDAPRRQSSMMDFIYVISTTSIEVLTHHIITNSLCEQDEKSIPIPLIIFPFITLYFEIILDFFHYWTHRLSHETILYRLFHKTHHQSRHPMAVETFHHHPVDLILTNTIPMILTVMLLPFCMDGLFWHRLLVYKAFVEISGHTSKIMTPSGSFPQCVWIVKWLDIQLFTEDHTLHHTLNNCNYSKRFSIWDKVFGTYRRFRVQK